MTYPLYYRHVCTEVLNATTDHTLLAWPGEGEDETVLCRIDFNGMIRTKITLTRKEALALKRFVSQLEDGQAMVERAGAK